MVKFTQLNVGKREAAVNNIRVRQSNGEIDVLLMQEPWADKNTIKNMYEGTIYRYTGELRDKQKIMAAIWVKKDVDKQCAGEILGDFTNSNMVTIKLNIKHKKGHIINLIVCSIYMPGCKTGETDNPITTQLKNLVKYIKDNNLEIIIGGDFNGHNTIWGSKESNPRGNRILDFIIDNNLALINKGSAPTFVSGGNETIIDLTLATKKVEKDISGWEVAQEESFSDHKTINFEIETEKINPIKNRTKKKTDWIKLCVNLEKNIKDINLDIKNHEELETAANQYREAIMKAYKSSNKEKIIKTNFHMEWFDNKLQEEKRELRKLYNKSNNNIQLNPLTRKKIRLDYKAKLKEYNKNIKKSKTNQWRRKMSVIESTKDIARLHKILESKKPPEVTTLIKNDGSHTNSNEEKTKLLMETHFPDCKELNSNNLPEVHEPYYAGDESLQKIKNISTESKITWAIESFSPFKSPGKDGIFPALLQKTSKISVPILKTLFRASLMLGYIPSSWRGTLVTFIPKAGKIAYDRANSYRPISLMSFILKVLEKLVDRGIREKHLIENPLNGSQHAYQTGKGTESASHYMTDEIEKSITNQGAAIVVFLDIAGAFDNTGFQTIEQSLRAKGVDAWIINWIMTMLKTRSIKASSLGSETSYNPTKGCPQGGCLSPLLWSIVMDALLNKLTIDGKFKVSAYADDLAIIITGHKNLIGAMSSHMNKAMKTVEQWCNETGLSVNPDKTVLMKFSKGTKDEPLNAIKIYGKKILRVKSFKYLGVIYDEKLNWGTHIEHAIEKGKKAIWACRNMVSKHWGLKPKVMLWIYNQIIKPRVTYGSIIWWHAAKKNQNRNKLKCIQRMALMLTTGAVRSTPTSALEALLNVIPLELEIERLAIKACARLIKAGTWIKKGGCKHLHKSIEAETTKLMNTGETDDCAREWNEGRRFNTTINDRKNWKYGLHIDNNDDCWYTDGSVRDGRAALGIANLAKGIFHNMRLSNHGTIMQAEVMGINVCAKICLEKMYINKQIVILCDSQAAIKSLNNSFITKKTTKECIDNLNKLGIRNKVTVAWVPGHSNVEGNEKADDLAVEAINREEVDLTVGEPYSSFEGKIMKSITAKALETWSEITNECKHAKQLIRGFDSKKAKYLMNCSRKDIRVLTGLLTGHGITKRYLKNMGKTDDDSCERCFTKAETVMHWIIECDDLDNRDEILFPSGDRDLKKIHYRNLLKFAKANDLYETFFTIDS